MPDPTPRHDGWTPARQHDFLESLAINGLVRSACRAADMSAEAAYRLRQRSGGAAFRLGWEAALLLARARLVDTLMERAIEGQEEVIVRDPDSHTRTRHRHDNRLAMALLARLDRFADDDAAPHADARIVAGDWDAFLDLIAAEGATESMAQFLDARRAVPAVPCQLRADDDDEEAPAACDPFDHLDVWWNPEAAQFRTNFPPPPGFDGQEYGNFDTDTKYQRTLTDEEARIETAYQTHERTVARAAAEHRRCAFFGLADPADGEVDVDPPAGQA